MTPINQGKRGGIIHELRINATNSENQSINRTAHNPLLTSNETLQIAKETNRKSVMIINDHPIVVEMNNSNSRLFQSEDYCTSNSRRI